MIMGLRILLLVVEVSCVQFDVLGGRGGGVDEGGEVSTREAHHCANPPVAHSLIHHHTTHHRLGSKGMPSHHHHVQRGRDATYSSQVSS